VENETKEAKNRLQAAETPDKFVGEVLQVLAKEAGTTSSLQRQIMGRKLPPHIVKAPALVWS